MAIITQALWLVIFSGVRLYKALSKKWYWEGMHMYGDCLSHSRNFPQCAIVQGTGKKVVRPLNPIPIERVFQILGVDIMELPKTNSGNKCVVVFQDFFVYMANGVPSCWPIGNHIAQKQVMPFMSIPEALLSDRGAKLLSSVMLQ